MKKVVIIGAGHVGSHCGFSLMLKGEVDEIIYIDIDEQKAIAQALDLNDTIANLDRKVVVKSGDYSDCQNAQIVVVAVGKSRLPGQTRLDMLQDSVKMVKSVIHNLKASNFNGIVINITNPADIIAHFLYDNLDLPKNKVLCTGTSLDSSRLKRIISEELKIDRKSINAFCMGEHGDSQMIPFSNAVIGAIPFIEIAKQRNLSLEEIQEKTRKAGTVVIDGKGSTEFGIGVVLSEIVKAIFRDERRIMPVSAFLDGEYGQYGIYAGVPAIIGKNGVEKIIEVNLTDEERKSFNKSCDVIKNYINTIKNLKP